MRTLLFDEAPLLDALRHAVEEALATRPERRARDYQGSAMWHHRQRSTEYFSKYLEAKAALERSKDTGQS